METDLHINVYMYIYTTERADLNCDKRTSDRAGILQVSAHSKACLQQVPKVRILKTLFIVCEIKVISGTFILKGNL